MSSNKDYEIFALNMEIGKLERFKKMALEKYPNLEEEFKKSEDERCKEECELITKCCCWTIVIVVILFFIFIIQTNSAQ